MLNVVNIVVSILHVIICLALVAVILLQSGKSAGLAGSIAGGAETFFGKKKGVNEFLGKVTIFVAVAFAVTSLILIFLAK